MTLLSLEEIERGLVAAGVSPEKARAEALRQTGRGPGIVPSPRIHRDADVAPIEEQHAIEWPLRLVLPWSHLISDNARHGVIEGKLLLTSAYRRAKGLTREKARPLVAGRRLADYPLALHARVWVPDDTRAHDVPNFAKCCHDALEGVIYVKDRWLYDARWTRAGVDVDSPRAEISITPYLDAA